jgi:hypothetical protein
MTCALSRIFIFVRTPGEVGGAESSKEHIIVNAKMALKSGKFSNQCYERAR